MGQIKKHLIEKAENARVLTDEDIASLEKDANENVPLVILPSDDEKEVIKKQVHNLGLAAKEAIRKG